MTLARCTFDLTVRACACCRLTPAACYGHLNLEFSNQLSAVHNVAVTSIISRTLEVNRIVSLLEW